MEDLASQTNRGAKRLGSYPASDVTFLLKDMSEVKLESRWMPES